MLRRPPVILVFFVSVFGASCSVSRAPHPDILDAKILLARNDADAAWSRLLDLHHNHPDDLTVIRLLIKAAAAAGKLDGLEPSFSCDRPSCLYGRGLLAAATGDISGGAGLLEQAFAAAPDQSEIRYRLAIVLLKRGDYQSAVDHLQAVRRSGFEDDLLPFRLARALAGLDRYQDAMTCLVDAVLSGMDREKRTMAMEQARHVVDQQRQLPPDINEQLLPILGAMKTDDAQIQALGASISNLMQRHPQSAALHSALGLWYLRTNREAKGAELLRQAIEMDPADPFPNLTLGSYLLAGQNAPAAMPYLQRAVQANPLDIRAQKLLLRAARATGDQAKEKDALTMLSAMLPQDLQYTIDLGSTAQRKGNLDQAQQAYQDVLKQDEHNLPALYGLALIHWERARRSAEHELRQARVERARHYLDALLELAPEHIPGNRLQQEIEAFNP